MRSTYLYLHQSASDHDLANAFANAFGTMPTQVAVISESDTQALGQAWDDESTRIVLRRSRTAGDFPVSLLLDVDDRVTNDFLAAIMSASKRLDTAILTDEVGVEPAFDNEWLLVTPNGTMSVVSVDPDMLDADEPALVLTPESRRTYHSLTHRPLAAAG